MTNTQHTQTYYMHKSSKHKLVENGKGEKGMRVVLITVVGNRTRKLSQVTIPLWPRARCSRRYSVSDFLRMDKRLVTPGFFLQ